VYGKYCHICGQENIVPKESALHLVSHFFQDITHFDGKFFTSLKYLLLKPGYLAIEYMQGRRASHLNPVRMYIFTSALFFLIFFSIYKVNDGMIKINGPEDGKILYDRVLAMDSITYIKFVDSLVAKKKTFEFAYNKIKYIYYLDSVMKAGDIRFTPTKYKTRAEYDSALANGKKHNWFMRKLVYKQYEINEKYRGQPKGAIKSLLDTLLHSLPQLLFFSLPLFALTLKLLYWRRKEYYYVNHAIFSIHLFVFTFIALFFVFALDKLEDKTGIRWLDDVSSIIVLVILFYTYKAMRHFYAQGRGKTILKFCLLLFLNLFILIFLFTVFLFLSLFKI
jgi:hypothetical protein